METQTIESSARRRELRDLKTSWLEAGNPNGPLLVFLHGYPDDPHAWDNQIKHFSKEYFIVCPYSRGLLPSDVATSLSRFNRKSIALDVLQILKIVDPTQQKPVICVGHDLGAVIAWYLAPLLGKRLKRLVIINGLSLEQMKHRLRSRPKQILKSWYIYPMLLPYVPEFIATHFPDHLQELTDRLGERDKPEPHEALQNNFLGPLNQYRAFMGEMMKLRRGPSKKVHPPTLILWGSRDAFILPPTVDEMEPYASDFTIRILEGNHWIHRTQAEQVNGLLDAFFHSGPNEVAL